MAVVSSLCVIAAGVCLWFMTEPESTLRFPSGQAQLVSVEALPEMADSCAPGDPGEGSMIAALERNSLLSVLHQNSVHAAGQNGGTTSDITRPPVRALYDTYPIYSSVAVDPVRDEVILQDTNLFGIRVFNRLDNTPPNVAATQPKRVIEGPDTKNEYSNGLYVDPQTGEIYNVAMDTADAIFVFRGGVSGNAEPQRVLRVPHRGFQIAIDEQRRELYSTNQYPPRVMVYRKDAAGDAEPLRVIEGPKTGLADVHGVAVDVQRNLLFVGNWGNASDHTVAGTGKFNAPSITIYSRDSKGDVAPLRTIQGPKTQLNWMGAISLDPETGNLWVANDVGGSVLVFRGTDNGDVAPMKMIKGDKTGLDHPAGVFVDTKNKEVWVANMGNSSATAYSLNAEGNAAPVRTIRSAPIGRRSLKFGKPQAVAYDSRREELLVPN
jgi:DNA-binding beta-propeller fold protein YncE